MIANKEKCADKDKSVCEYNDFTRLRYFHGMLLDENDFKAEQSYHNAKRRFLNRMLHGSGVVCGLELHGDKNGQSIEITSGLALDCSGNEIWVKANQPINLASLLPDTAKGTNEGECIEEPDGKPKSYCIGIRYEEKPSNPVAVYLPSGSCEQRPCENSRVKEGYCIEIVPCCEKKADDPRYPGLIKKLCGCTDTYTPPDLKSATCPVCSKIPASDKKELCECITMEQFCEQSVPCPGCCSCEKPCFVVLGRIEVNEECRLESICINDCRQYVLTPHLLQHILRGVFTGATGENGYIKMKTGNNMIPLPTEAEDWIYNPIQALCWWLPKAVNGGSLTWLPCKPAPAPAEQPDLESRFAQMESTLKRLEADNEAIRQDVAIFKKFPQLEILEAEKPEVAAAEEAVNETPATEKPNAVTKPSASKPTKPGK